jgi:hypothetical protein
MSLVTADVNRYSVKLCRGRASLARWLTSRSPGPRPRDVTMSVRRTGSREQQQIRPRTTCRAHASIARGGPELELPQRAQQAESGARADQRPRDADRGGPDTRLLRLSHGNPSGDGDLLRASVETLATEVYSWRLHTDDELPYWVTGQRAADILGVSRARLSQLAVEHRVPFVRHQDGTRLYRREQLEIIASSGSHRRRRLSATQVTVQETLPDFASADVDLQEVAVT